MTEKRIILAFDTANEVISLAVGRLDFATQTIEPLAQQRIPAHRASNTLLLPSIDALLQEHGIDRDDIACVACGRGPGSFTGVRICLATAKGMACALEVPLLGVCTLDAIAWELAKRGVEGRVLLVGDAMRREVYPARFELQGGTVVRTNVHEVAKAEAYAQSLDDGNDVLICGDALEKYLDLFQSKGSIADKDWWTLHGEGLLWAIQGAWQEGEIDPFDGHAHDPAVLLPVYTRLSDAEENERARLALTDKRDLHTGVQHTGVADDTTGTEVAYRPMDASQAEAIAEMELQVMGTDAWTELMIADELGRPDRSWWTAVNAKDGTLVGYAGGLIAAGQLQILKVACDPEWRRRGIATQLLGRLAQDARDLGAHEATLEVRVSNVGAHQCYERLGMHNVGRRPRYYSDREDAYIYTGPLPIFSHDVAGMELSVDQAAGNADAADGVEGARKPLILAIESSCDETAAAVLGGDHAILADTIASQIDFHARFGGVVPEIASRKHIEAICGVTQVCLESAAHRLGVPALRWRDLDAVAVTYAPGLVGALVVGAAFAKAAAWAARIPCIAVNHLEGHLYANKLDRPDIEVPLVASLVSGGHTMLVHVRDWGDYRILGSTIDDAVGEAFDKVAKAMGLGYPGGPIVSRLAAQGDPAAIDFPRAMMHSGDLRFSLSGLKTAVITYMNNERAAGRELNLPDIAASFQAAVIDVQVAKAATALDETGAREFCLGGGVAANPALRGAYERMCASRGVQLTMPAQSACTDNAAMIALVAHDRFQAGKFMTLDFDAAAHADLEQPY